MAHLIPAETIASKIVFIRGKKVMIDKDLAKLYGVATKNLNKAVKRNLERFPEDFMFQLNEDEVERLRFHFGTSKRGGLRYRPYVFTQEGVAMLSGVLNSPRAVQVNIQIMRVFIKLREVIATHKDLAIKIDELEKKYSDHDDKISEIFKAIRRLMEAPASRKVIRGFAQK